MPYIELYSRQAEELFLDLSADLDEVDYSAEAYLQVSRRFSSRIRDLFLPSFFELSLEKQFLKDADLTDLFNTYTFTVQSTALNLFGELGAYPLFPFYRTDEFSSSLSLSFEVDGKSVQSETPLRTLGMNLDHYFSFEGHSNNTLSLENRLNLLYDRAIEVELEKYEKRVQWGDTVSLLYDWNRYPEAGVRLPLLPKRLGADGYWSHRESLELVLNGAGESTSYHPFDLIVGHKSTALLPDFGEISAELSAGFDVERTEAGDRYWRIGLRGGITAQLQF